MKKHKCKCKNAKFSLSKRADNDASMFDVTCLKCKSSGIFMCMLIFVKEPPVGPFFCSKCNNDKFRLIAGNKDPLFRVVCIKCKRALVFSSYN